MPVAIAEGQSREGITTRFQGHDVSPDFQAVELALSEFQGRSQRELKLK